MKRKKHKVQWICLGLFIVCRLSWYSYYDESFCKVYGCQLYDASTPD